MVGRHTIAVLASLLFACGGDRPAPVTRSPILSPDHAGSESSAVASPVFGVTIADPWSPSAALLAALDGLVDSRGRRPMARVVFDEGIDRIFRRDGATASDYVPHVATIGQHARIMGTLLDSRAVAAYDVAQLRARACEYRAALGHLVDVWEIGNEVNGEWLLRDGEPDTAVVDALLAVVDVFEADAAQFAALCPGMALRPDERPFELAMTAYGNGGETEPSCWQRAPHHMETWLETHFGDGGRARAIRDAIDYVLVSYYEDDCEGIQPDWPRVFDRLGALFPSARLGFGECGTNRLAERARYVERYYAGMGSSDPAFANMHVQHPRYVGGSFWWYFDRDYGAPRIYDVFVAALSGPFWSR